MMTFLRNFFQASPTEAVDLRPVLAPAPRPVREPVVIDAEGRAVLPMPRELVVHRRQQFRRDVLDAVDRGAVSVSVDCGETAYIDTSGLGVLIGLTRALDERGVVLSLARLSDGMRELVAASGIHAVLHIAPSEEAPR